MTSLFAELEKRVSDAIDQTMGEATRIERLRSNVYFADSADGSRPTTNVVGIIDFNPVAITAQDEGQYDGLQPHLAGERIHVSYATKSFASASHWPRQGDVITALDRDGQPKLKVIRIDQDGIGRFICVCEKI